MKRKKKNKRQRNKLSFTGINYIVCHYCKHQVIAGGGTGSNWGCSKIKNKAGQYARVTIGLKDVEKLKEKGIDAVPGFRGCKKFKASGLSAHPKALKWLIKINKRCVQILSDPNALETSSDFAEKMLQFPHVECPLLDPDCEFAKNTVQ